MIENLSPEKGLANGTAAILSSLTLAVSSEHFWMEYNSAEPGKVFELEDPPLAVNVQVPAWEQMKVEETLYSEVEGTVVVPLKASGWNECKLKTKKGTRVVRGRNKGAIKFRDHPYELGFALTYHKLRSKDKP
jgi:hypothetical protein